MIDYQPAVEVQTAADLVGLGRAPEAFKQAVLARLAAQTGCEGAHEFVSRVSLDGFAISQIVCTDAGAHEVWADDTGTWQVIASTENFYPCSALQAHHFPASLLGPNPECMAGTSTVNYTGS